MDQITLVTAILDECNKGTSLTDPVVRGKIDIALRSLEVRHQWAYMRQFSTFNINVNSSPRFINSPGGLKSVEFLRLLDTPEAGDYWYLNEVAAKDVDKTESGLPNAYWKSSSTFILDNTPDQDYSGEISYFAFTTYENTNVFEPWLMANTYPLVFYETLKHLTPYLREPELLQIYAALGKDALNDALRMNEEYELANQSMVMQYAG